MKPALTRREERARAALVDAATEFASAIGHDQVEGGTYDIPLSVAEAMNALYRANDEWQEAQLAAARNARRSLSRGAA